MSDLGSVLAIAVKLGQAFDELGIPYIVTGSVASSILGERRFTNDIDLAVRMNEDKVTQLAARLGGDFFVDEESMRAEVRRRGSWNLVELRSGLKIDLFFHGDMLDRSAFARRRVVRVNPEGDTISLSTVEDMILRKILWYREGGLVSERQWRDIVQMLRLNPAVDAVYLDEWADWLDIQKLLALARTDAASPAVKRG